MHLLAKLKKQLAAGKPMPFVEFMQLALYAPYEGYYTSTLAKLGRQGDFITAPELTPLFGKTIANQCQQIMANLNNPSLLEYGAGSGKLCVDVLSQLEALHSLPQRYYILEVSADLALRQQTYISEAIPHLAAKVQWLSALPKSPFNGVILANEVLDAMPVHRFMQTATAVLESHVTLDERESVVETFLPCQNQALLSHIQERLPALAAPYISEVNLFLDAWMATNYDLLQQGAVLLIDYGFPRHEYYHRDRKEGTLMCHYQHRAHTNWLLHIGEQDITAHVDFTHVAEASHKAGFHVAGYTSQAAFLLANGLLDCIPQSASPKTQLQAKAAIKQLTEAHEMGELFKVMALTKNLDVDLQGFQLQDRRRSL